VDNVAVYPLLVAVITTMATHTMDDATRDGVRGHGHAHGRGTAINAGGVAYLLHAPGNKGNTIVLTVNICFDNGFLEMRMATSNDCVNTTCKVDDVTRVDTSH